MKTHNQYVKNFIESESTVTLAFDYLKSRGYDVEFEPHTITPDSESRFKHFDDGDLKITINGESYRVEVKHIRIDFTSIEDFPFDSVIIDEVYKINKHHTYPLWAYMIFNKASTGFIFVPVTTKMFWYSQQRLDKYENEVRNFCFIKKDYLKYYAIKH